MTDTERDTPQETSGPVAGDAPDGDRRAPDERSPAPRLPDLLRRVQGELGELIGRPVEGISRVERTADGWDLGVEVLELSKVPRSTDLLASYDVDADPDGAVVGWRRARRYARGARDE